MKQKPKSYSDFTLEHLQEMFGIQNRQVALNLSVESFKIPQWLTEVLAIALKLPRGTEKIKSEVFVTPILMALFEANPNQFQYFSGYTFDVDTKQALRGRCDFLLSKSLSTFIDAPVFGIFEAKDDSIEHWYGQCGAEMYAAQLFNEQKGKPLAFVHGAVTNGLTWQFLKLQNADLQIDTQYYTLQDLPTLLGTLQGILALYD